MKTGNLILFNPSKRLLKKARKIVDNVELFLSNAEQGVDCLIEALSFADAALKLKIIPLLGFSGKEKVLAPLYELIVSTRQDDRVRQMAAVQMSIVVSRLKDSPKMREQLIMGLSHQEGAIRESCALALGWEGNTKAVKHLVQCLNDSDRGVQAAAASALSAVDDDSAFDLLVGRLSNGTFEEKKNILLNLWRFTKKAYQVESVYIEHLADSDNDIRIDALSGLAMIPPSSKILEAYRKLLTNEKGSLLRQTLENLSGMEPLFLKPLHEELRRLAGDPDARIRQEAIRLLSGPV